MVVQLIEGRPIAKEIIKSLKNDLKKLKNLSVAAIHNIESPHGRIYMRMQRDLFQGNSIKYKTFDVDSRTSSREALEIINRLNNDSSICGISVHLPLPRQLNQLEILSAISPVKDIEGTHPHNIGMISFSDHLPVPCAAQAAYEIVRRIKPALKGLDVCVIGHSSMVGKPLSMLLLQSPDAAPTVTVCHIATKDLKTHTKIADILFVAAGKPGLIQKEMVKKGAIIIDIGINKSGDKIVGDVDFDGVKQIASFITPVPGGVGPVTMAMLLKNTIKCAKLQGH